MKKLANYMEAIPIQIWMLFLKAYAPNKLI